MTTNPLFRFKRSTKIGTYTFAMGAVILALLAVANLLVGALPAKLTQFTIVSTSVSEISEETEKFVGSLTEDVTVYWLCEEGTEKDNEQFRLMLTRYEEAGKHLTVKTVDPLQNPTFTAKYTDGEISNYSLIVESQRRFQIVDFADMQYITSAYIGEDVPLTTEEFDYYRQMLYQQSGGQVDILTYGVNVYFEGEARLTSAIDFVTKESIPHAYLLTGHGDTKPTEELLELLRVMNLEVEEVNLQNATAVPADAGCVIIHAPKDDISGHEATLIKDYVKAGGSVMLTTAPANVTDCPNLLSVAALFGLSAEEGIVIEGDLNYTAGSSTDVLVPSVSSQHYATAYVAQTGYKARMPQSHAIAVSETLPTGVTVTPLFTTSEKAKRVSPTDVSTTIGEKGTHNVAVAATLSVTRPDGTATTADLTWYGSTAAFTDEQAANTSGGNYYYYAATLSYMSEGFSSAFEALSAVNVSGELLSGLTFGAVIAIGIVIVIVLPVTLLTVGIVVWFRRKRR